MTSFKLTRIFGISSKYYDNLWNLIRVMVILTESLESQQNLWNLNRIFIILVESLESRQKIQNLNRIFGISAEFLESLESFQNIWNLSRIFGIFGIFAESSKDSRIFGISCRKIRVIYLSDFIVGGTLIQHFVSSLFYHCSYMQNTQKSLYRHLNIHIYRVICVFRPVLWWAGP